MVVCISTFRRLMGTAHGAWHLPLAGCVVAVTLWLIAPAAQAIQVQRVVSAKGIEAWLVEDHRVPVISLQLAFRGGAALDPAGKEGLSTMVASLLDEGAGSLDSQEFQRRLEEKSIRLSFSASTDSFGGSLSTLTQNRDTAFDMLRMSLTVPRFDQGPRDRIESQMLASIQAAAENPRRIAGEVWYRAAYPDHAYGRSSQGTKRSITRISKDDLEAYTRQRFGRDRLYVAVVGDISAAALRPLLDIAFGDIRDKVGPVQVPKVVPRVNGDVYVVQKKIPQSVITFGHAGIARNDPDYYTAYVLNSIFGGGGLTSKLMEEVREKRGLAYSVYTSLMPYDYSAVMIGGAATRNEKVAETIEIIRNEWAKLRNDGVSDQDLADAKTFLTGSFLTQIGSSGRMASLLLGMQLENLGIDYIDRRNGYINAVTQADLRRVAARLLQPSRLTFVIVGAPVGVTPTAKAPDLED
jgi:zinc protease